MPPNRPTPLATTADIVVLIPSNVWHLPQHVQGGSWKKTGLLEYQCEHRPNRKRSG